MLKKIAFVSFALIFLTGCSVDYKIDINNIDEIVENIEFNSESDSDTNSIGSFGYAIPTDKANDETIDYNVVKGSDSYYKLDKLENNTKMILNHTYDIYKYKDVFLPILCYDYFDAINSEEDGVILSTSNKFKCFDSYPELSSVNVIITSKYKTIENNADEVNDNTYTWHITRENADNKYLYLSIDANSIDNSKENRYTIIIASIFGLIASIICVFLLFKNKLNNRL